MLENLLSIARNHYTMVREISNALAFICFFISVDALDALVNAFKKDEVKLKDYFYKKAINPRYFGFLLLILEVIFITTYHNPIFACVLLGLFLTIGYSHLFPNVRNPRDSQLEAFVIGVVLILVPVGVELYL